MYLKRSEYELLKVTVEDLLDERDKLGLSNKHRGRLISSLIILDRVNRQTIKTNETTKMNMRRYRKAKRRK